MVCIVGIGAYLLSVNQFKSPIIVGFKKKIIVLLKNMNDVFV